MTWAAMRRLEHPDCRQAPGVGSLTLRPWTFPRCAFIVDPATFVVYRGWHRHWQIVGSQIPGGPYDEEMNA